MPFSRKYTILFMRDDGGTRRFRCSRRVLLLMVAAWLFVLVGGSVSLWRGVQSEKARLRLERENRALIAVMRQDQATLERLARRVVQAISASSGTVSPKPVPPVDRKIVSVRETAFTRLDRKRLRLVLDMFTVSPPSLCSGRVMFSLCTADGRVLPLLHDDTRFRILRFRRFDLVASLPLEPVRMAGSSIMLEVLVGGELVFRRHYPLK